MRDGRLLTKVGTLPVVVFWHEDRAFAIEDRCPHLGFPLHQGTVEAGLVTCHWHHARFDLRRAARSTCGPTTLRLRRRASTTTTCSCAARAGADPVGHLQRRLRDGLEDGISLVIAKSVLGLLEAGVRAERDRAHRRRLRHCATATTGWGAGLTRARRDGQPAPPPRPGRPALALVHGLAFVARDTRNHAPRFPCGRWPATDCRRERLARWYRRFVDTRSSDAAERTLATALADGRRSRDVEAMMFAAVTDHVFIDGGHTLDFTNKAFEALDHLGTDAAAAMLPTLVRQTAAADRSEEFGEWRHPHDLAG